MTHRKIGLTKYIAPVKISKYEMINEVSKDKKIEAFNKKNKKVIEENEKSLNEFHSLMDSTLKKVKQSAQKLRNDLKKESGLKYETFSRNTKGKNKRNY